MNEIEKMIKAVGGSIDEYREVEKMISEVREHKTVEITAGALDNMIGYMRELIYEYKDEEADSSTHPFEVGFLDYLISVKEKQTKQGGK